MTCMFHVMFVVTTAKEMVCAWKLARQCYSNYVGLGGSSAHNQPKLVYLSKFPTPHVWFQQEPMHYGRKKEARKFHRQLQRKLKQCVTSMQPLLVRIPIDETGEILSGRKYWQQKVREVTYHHLNVLIRNFRLHIPKQWVS